MIGFVLVVFSAMLVSQHCVEGVFGVRSGQDDLLKDLVKMIDDGASADDVFKKMTEGLYSATCSVFQQAPDAVLTVNWLQVEARNALLKPAGCNEDCKKFAKYLIDNQKAMEKVVLESQC